MESNQLRKAFTNYFVERGHISVPSAALIPHDNTVLFTVAGMVPFKPFFLGEEAAPYPRATSIQKCMRAGGKHNDLDQIGRTLRHLTFFEMLGNFSFGDYFKEDAIPFAWGLVTEVLGLDPEKLWVTVHVSDDEAESIWRDKVGVKPERIQRLDEDNWWQMADTGPCGPCSEIYYDKGPEYGSDGGPAHGSDERFLEFWNLVFMQYERQASGELLPLPKPCIDTGAGLERVVTILQGKESVYETDLMAPILEVASSITGTSYGQDHEEDVALRIIADHSRSMTFLVADGVFPTNEGRGYVLRRIIRRAILRTFMLGASDMVAPRLVNAVIDTMGGHYVELERQRDYIVSVIEREEEAFRHRLKVGFSIFEEHAQENAISGEVAFRLHDTFGFPVELTKEIAQERGVELDLAGFEIEMARARELSRSAGLGGEKVSANQDQYLSIVERFGHSEFSGYSRMEDESRLLAVLPDPHDSELVELFFDRTPFYPEGGGQVGDTGEILWADAKAEVLETSYALTGLIRHRARVTEGAPDAGGVAKLVVDGSRRSAVMRNHTGTHLLHWALRAVLGEHVKQMGSLVAPDRLRFDFSHWDPLSSEQRLEVERLVNIEIISNAEVSTIETSKDEAISEGAIAFFGDRYQEIVRVVRAGAASVELCGGTHVQSLGTIGPLKIVSEASIGSNTRRIEALTGEAALKYIWEEEALLDQIGATLKAPRSELLGRFEALRQREKELSELSRSQRDKLLRSQAEGLSVKAKDGTLVERVDGLTQEDLRELANLVKSAGVEIVVLGGTNDAGRATLVCSVRPGGQLAASEIIREGARLIGGGVGRQSDFAMTGGKDIAEIDAALQSARSAVA